MVDAAATNTGLRAIVSEGAGVRSVREHLLRGPRGWFSLPEAAVQTTALVVDEPLGATALARRPRFACRTAPTSLLIYAGRGSRR